MTSGITKKSFVCIALAFASVFVLNAQDASEDHEIIIIERTVDENGNEISKTITRKRGRISDDELKKLESKELRSPYQRFELGEFGNLGELFGTQNWQQPLSLGLMINFNDGSGNVADVVAGSGADKADIRKGDEIIAIQGETVSTIEDVKKIINRKAEGDIVEVLLFRDGEEIEKEVELKVNNFGGVMDLNADLFERLRNQRNFFNLDSLFDSFDFDGFNFREGDRLAPIYPSEKGSPGIIQESARPQLGVFIEDREGGIVISDVIKGSPAEKAGLQKDDIILRINDDMVTSFSELAMLINRYKNGDKVLVEYERNRKKQKVEVQL